MPKVRPFQAALLGRSASTTSDLMAPGPAFHSKREPTAKGPWVTTDCTPGIHRGQEAMSVKVSQTASGVASTSISAVS